MIVKENIEIQVDSNRGILWVQIGSPFELHYSYKTICSFSESLEPIINLVDTENIKHIIMLSANKEVWNMGGDLEMFANSVLQNVDAKLEDYAYKCIEVLEVINKGFYHNIPVTSLIQGNAFGGGFECALAGSYIIAEEHAKFSFPEVLFGTFPGMGAYSFLTRKIGFTKANQMIESGEKWTANEMQQAGLIDFVCQTGKAVETVIEKISNNELNSTTAFAKFCKEVPKEELKQIVDIWLTTTKNLSSNKIDLMLKIVEAQKKKIVRTIDTTRFSNTKRI